MALLTDASGRLVGITVEDYTGQSCWALLGDFLVLLKPSFSSSSHVNQKAHGSCEFFLPRLQQNREVRGQVKNLEGPQLFSLLRLWVAKVLQSTISAPVSLLLSQRKGIQQGPEGPSQSPCGQKDAGYSNNNGQESLTHRQCTLAPYCYYDKEKCFH